jgi:predicted butyrate kinase (DUF1464 family)
MQKKRRHARKQSKPRGEGLEERVTKLEKNSFVERVKDVFTGAALFSAIITGKHPREYVEIIKERLH